MLILNQSSNVLLAQIQHLRVLTFLNDNHLRVQGKETKKVKTEVIILIIIILIKCELIEFASYSLFLVR